jgi:hypothetical protein
MHLSKDYLRFAVFMRFLILVKFLPYSFARNEKSDHCAVCLGVAKELQFELAKSANSTEIIELARFDFYLIPYHF